MHVLYIRGLGDGNAIVQRLAVKLWRLHGVRPHFFNHRWSDSETLSKKIQRLNEQIDQLYKTSETPIGLIGVSAGASLALSAFAVQKSKVAGVVCISGKIQRPENLGKKVRKHNPAFIDSMELLKSQQLQLSLADRARIRSVFSSGDHLVNARDSMIEGANNVLVHQGGHGRTIARQITLSAKPNINFLKQL